MLAHAIGTRPPPDLRDCLPGAPAAAADVLRRGMSADPAERPRTAGELVATLRAALDPPRLQATLPAPAADPPRRKATLPAPAADPPRRKAALAPRPVVEAPLVELRERPRRPATAARLSSPARSGGARPSDRSIGADRGPLSQNRYRSNRRLRPGALALIALGAVVAAVAAVAALSTGGGGAHQARNAHVLGPGRGRTTPAHRRATTGAQRPSSTQASSTVSSRADTATSSRSASGASGDAAATATPASSTGSSGGGAISPSTPPGAVQMFYEQAARHNYGAAWALATPNLRSQEEGYAAFRSQMSVVRSITFHEARTVSGHGSSAATVALSTTAVHADKTQNCSGTAQTVKTSRNTWLVDHIAISCTGA
jgi:hypothetical protein